MTDDSKRAGWYPDPDGAPGERWWNGVGWSDSRRGGVTTPPAAAPVRARPTPVLPTPVIPTPAATLPAAAVPPVPMPAVPVPSVAVPPPAAAAYRPDPYAPAGAVPTAARPATAAAAANVNTLGRLGFIFGLISVFFNIAYVLAPAAIVLSALGIRKARELQAQGNPRTLMSWAVVGLCAGILGTLLSIMQLIFFIAAIASN